MDTKSSDRPFIVSAHGGVGRRLPRAVNEARMHARLSRHATLISTELIDAHRNTVSDFIRRLAPFDLSTPVSDWIVNVTHQPVNMTKFLTSSNVEQNRVNARQFVQTQFRR